jgi:hypothetical protein
MSLWGSVSPPWMETGTQITLTHYGSGYQSTCTTGQSLSSWRRTSAQKQYLSRIDHLPQLETGKPSLGTSRERSFEAAKVGYQDVRLDPAGHFDLGRPPFSFSPTSVRRHVELQR